MVMMPQKFFKRTRFPIAPAMFCGNFCLTLHIIEFLTRVDTCKKFLVFVTHATYSILKLHRIVIKWL